MFYKLADGRIWDTEEAQWVDPVMTANEVGQETPQDVILELVSAEGKSDVEYLAQTLAFYDYPLGELVIYSIKGIKEELKRLDAAYLTPRTLAELSMNDSEAISRWNEHEEKAIPLRERLRELEALEAEKEAQKELKIGNV